MLTQLAAAEPTLLASSEEAFMKCMRGCVGSEMQRITSENTAFVTAVGSLLRAVAEQQPAFSRGSLFLLGRWRLRWLGHHSFSPRSPSGEFQRGCEEVKGEINRGLAVLGEAAASKDDEASGTPWMATCIDCINAAYANSQGAAKTAAALALFKAVAAKIAETAATKGTTLQKTISNQIATLRARVREPP